MAMENRNIVMVNFEGRRYRVLFDLGAMVSLVGSEIAEQCRERLRPSSTVVRGVNGGTLRVLGKLDLLLGIDGQIKPLEVRAIERMDHQMILGIDFCKLRKSKIRFAEKT